MAIPTDIDDEYYGQDYIDICMTLIEAVDEEATVIDSLNISKVCLEEGQYVDENFMYVILEESSAFGITKL